MQKNQNTKNLVTIDFAPPWCCLGLVGYPSMKPTLVHQPKSNFSPHLDFPHTWKVYKENQDTKGDTYTHKNPSLCPCNGKIDYT
jgi:hypothetical protein